MSFLRFLHRKLHLSDCFECPCTTRNVDKYDFGVNISRFSKLEVINQFLTPNLKSSQNVFIALEYTLFVFVKYRSWANQNPWSLEWTPNKYPSGSQNCNVFFVYVFRQKIRFSQSVKKQRVIKCQIVSARSYFLERRTILL